MIAEIGFTSRNLLFSQMGPRWAGPGSEPWPGVPNPPPGPPRRLAAGGAGREGRALHRPYKELPTVPIPPPAPEHQRPEARGQRTAETQKRSFFSRPGASGPPGGGQWPGLMLAAGSGSGGGYGVWPRCEAPQTGHHHHPPSQGQMDSPRSRRARPRAPRCSPWFLNAAYHL
jgi:hypothetical protein